MEVQVIKCKQYNSTYKYIVMVNGHPVCIVKSQSRASNIVAYLNGYDVEINDGKIKRKLDELKQKEGGQ